MAEYPAPVGHAIEPRIVEAFIAPLRQRYGDAIEAVLIYGSALRGKRDTVWDLYVLLDDYRAIRPWPAALANRVLAPNVYYLATSLDGHELAAKYATVTLDAFERAMDKTYDLYFWARFAQPAVACAVRNERVRQRIESARSAAARRLLETTVPLMPERFTTRALWAHAFTATYGCELRSERAERATELSAAYETHLAGITRQHADTLGLALSGDDCWSSAVRALERRAAARRWRLRKPIGKLLAACRLIKAAMTFNDALGYVLWKVERHSGIRESATPLQRRHPLLFGWPVVWRLFRRGGFR